MHGSDILSIKVIVTLSGGAYGLKTITSSGVTEAKR